MKLTRLLLCLIILIPVGLQAQGNNKFGVNIGADVPVREFSNLAGSHMSLGVMYMRPMLKNDAFEMDFGGTAEYQFFGSKNINDVEFNTRIIPVLANINFYLGGSSASGAGRILLNWGFGPYFQSREAGAGDVKITDSSTDFGVCLGTGINVRNYTNSVFQGDVIAKYHIIFSEGDETYLVTFGLSLYMVK